MKKNKLYTANRWNQPLFMERNLFRNGGFTNPFGVNHSAPVDGGGSGLSSKGGAGWGMAGAAAGALGSANTGDPRGMWDTLDPVYHLADGRESAAGNAMSDAGVSLTQAGLSSGNSYLALAGAGLKIIGGLTNAAFGIKENADLKKDVEAGISRNKNFVSNAGSFDEVQGPVGAATNTDVYKGGWFSGDKARRKNEELKRRMIDARQLAFRSIDNNINNLVDDQMNDALANYSAYGGFLGDDGMCAINYGFMSDYLTNKKQEIAQKNKTAGITSMPAFMPNSFAIGGDLQANGADWTNGLTHINAGLSHEENPNEGVQLGVDPEGTPNLVEEGETIFDDYVYSNRILADAQTKEKFGLPRKKDITFADISKKLEKESSERPNDPISQAGLKAQMHQLADEQERQKQEMDAQRAKEAFEALSPEEQTALMQQRAEQEAMAQQQPTPEEMAMVQQQQMMQADGSEAALGQEPQIAVNGGKLFAPGGYLWDKFWSPVNEYSKKKGNTRGKYQIDKEWEGNIKELEDSEAYKAFTNYILNDATDEERMKYFQWIDANTGRDNKYITDGKLADNWKDMYQAARTDGLYGIQHYTPEWQAAETTTEPSIITTSPTSTPRVFHAMVDDDDYIQGELDPKVVGAEVRREILPNGDTVIYHNRVKSTDDIDKGNGKKDIAPTHRPEWLRYTGLFGPAMGLGLMGLGVGKPDTAQLDATIEGAGDVTPADWKPLGNYLTYRPLDIWFEQNALNAQSRATDRALMNTSSGNRGTAMAGLLANGYNSQVASGNLFRQAQEYNDNLRKQVAEFNRGTDQFNSEQFGATSRFNADAYNNARRANAQLRLQAAAQKMDADAGWYNSLYGNIAGLFKGIGDIGTENFRMNRIGEMAARGDFGTATDETYGFEPYLTRSNRKSKKNR